MRRSVKKSGHAGKVALEMMLGLFLLSAAITGWTSNKVQAREMAESNAVSQQPIIGFDVCLRDDSSGITIQFSSTTGAYQVASGSGAILLTGTGTAKVKSCMKTLTHLTTSRRVRVILDACAKKGNAEVQILSPGPALTLTITDRDTSNSQCSQK